MLYKDIFKNTRDASKWNPKKHSILKYPQKVGKEKHRDKNRDNKNKMILFSYP